VGGRGNAGARVLVEVPAEQGIAATEVKKAAFARPHVGAASISWRELAATLKRRLRLFLAIEGGLLLACLLYCLLAPNQYEATARVELRTRPTSTLNLDGESSLSPSLASVALETDAGILRSDELAWKVITGLKLYESPGFRGSFAGRFPAFRPDAPSPPAAAWLLERFARRLEVQTVPRTLLIEIRFRSHDAALSAAVVNALLAAYDQRQSELQVQETREASKSLADRLHALNVRAGQEEQRLSDFQKANSIVTTSDLLPGGEPGAVQHGSAGAQIDDLGRQLVAATADRIMAEADYRAATTGDPEMVLAADDRDRAGKGGLSLAALEQIQARRRDLEQEQAQLSTEHGPNFPRVVEIARQLQELDQQKKVEDARLIERFRSNWQAALDREQLVRKSLGAATAEGLKLNHAATQYVLMRQEANASHEVYTKSLERLEEVDLAAGDHISDFTIVDSARQPVKPVSPNLPLDLAITFFTGLWVALGGVLLADSLNPPSVRSLLLLVTIAAGAGLVRAQAPTPSTSGLPTGVASFPQTPDTRVTPNPKDSIPAPPQAGFAGVPPAAGPPTSTPMPMPIAAGDILEISESHTPEFRSTVRVSPAGVVKLPLVNEVEVSGMDESGAAHAIEAVLMAKGMLRHPIVSVLVTGYAGQDVSVLGEVARPGVYPYAVHHRLLDLIAAASGLSPMAGRVANIFHASDPDIPHPVVFDPAGADASTEHNPELSPGDTVQVSRTGLVYVVGDVIRPGGFTVDPAQGLTVVQAVSLAWGPSLNASAGKAVLIREQKGGRTLTTINLKRMLRGQDPDQPVQDHDIIFVPDSMARNLLNRTLESAIQSTIGVTIYSALVYSQRY
jgi:uncharacterized protein involved in exopolysaccharide biosynthesis/protein involved in polysaccharide export with SLBB domain